MAIFIKVVRPCFFFSISVCFNNFVNAVSAIAKFGRDDQPQQFLGEKGKGNKDDCIVPMTSICYDKKIYM